MANWVRRFKFKPGVFFILGALIGLSFLTYSVMQTLKEKNKLLAGLNMLMSADIQMDELSFVQTENGASKWRIRASQVEVFEGRKEAVLKDLEVEFKLPEGLGMTFRGSQGRLDTERHDFEVFSEDRDITINFNNGYSIATGSLKWMNQDQRISTSDPVEIKGPGLKINGQGMEARLASQELKVLSDVRVELY